MSNLHKESWNKRILDLFNYGDYSGWFGNNTGGKYLQQFEDRFGECCKTSFAFGVSSGSAALYTALRACNVGIGDRVAVPTYTHIGSVAPIVLTGARPYFVDTDQYGNFNPFEVEDTQFKAIIIVHQLGNPCNMEQIKKRIFPNTFIIEDASHALFGEYGKRRVGSLGDIAAFSVGGGRTKTIGCGEGGMVVTNNEKLAARVKNIRNHGDRNSGVPYFCFDNETDILTEDGWKSFQDLNDEKVATLNEAGSIEYHKPSAHQTFQYNGKLLHWNGKRVDLKVTPEHNLYVANRYNSFKIRNAKEVFPLVDARFLVASEGYNGNKLNFFEIPECDNYNNRTMGITKFPIIPWLKFLGWYLTEGCITKNIDGYKISIAQDKKENIPEIVNCIRELGFHPWFSRWGTCVTFASKELYYYLKQFGHAYDRFIPKEVKQLSPELLRILVETMMKGDGSGVVYYTCSEQLADDFQEIISKIGYGSNKTMSKGRNTYYITIAKEHLTTNVEKVHRSSVDYNGYVYDVTVPNHIILVRRNGKVMWSGNCFNFRMSEWNAALGLSQMDFARAITDQQISNSEYILKLLPEWLKHWGDTPGSKSTRYIIGCTVDVDRNSHSLSKISDAIDKLLEKLGKKGYYPGQPRKVISRGYKKLVSEIDYYSKWSRGFYTDSDERIKTSLWIDYHRYPRTKEEIDKMLQDLKEVGE